MCTFTLPFTTIPAIIENEPMEIPDMYHAYIRSIIKG
jgi:hypothetical protein